MSLFTDLIDNFNTLKTALLPASAPVNSVKPEKHSQMLDPLRDALIAHANDTGMHSGGLPAGAIGSILVNQDAASTYGALAAGTNGQELVIDTSGLNPTPAWAKLKLKLNLYIETGGYCYLYYNTPDDTTRTPTYALKNVYIRDNKTGKKLYLDDNAGNKEFTIAATGYLYLLTSDFLSKTTGSNIYLRRDNVNVANADYLLSSFDLTGIIPVDYSVNMVTGQLASLANEYQISNKAVENVAVVTNEATINIFKHNKQIQRSRIGHDANLTIKTITRLNIPNTEGYIIVDNTHATNSITVDFTEAFAPNQFTIEAQGSKIFKYIKKLSADTKLAVYDITGEGGSFELIDDTSPQLGGDLDTNYKRVLQSQGDDIASVNNITLDSSLNGNTYVITGTSQLNLIETLDWQDGAEITLQFADVLILAHNATPNGDFAPIILAKGSDYTTVAGDTINFSLVNGEWYEITNTKEGGGGGGGHVIQENGTSVTEARANLNFVSANGEDVVQDNAANDSSDIVPTIKSQNDFDATGMQAGDVIQRNAVGDGFDVAQTAPDEKILPIDIEPNLSADSVTALSVVTPAGYRRQSVIIKNETANAVTGGINLGTTVGGSEIVASEPVGANAVVEATQIYKFDSDVNDTDMYISAVTAWNSATLTLYFTFLKTI